MSYLEQFVDSMQFLERFDKSQRRQKFNYDDILYSLKENTENKDLQVFLDNNLGAIADGFIKNSPGSLANLCHSVSQQFYENWMSQEIGERAPVAITVGTVEYRNQKIYNVSKSSIKKIMSKGFSPDESLNVHVWLTFSNMTVLDLTIIPTLISKKLAVPSDFGDRRHVIWSENCESHFKYTPFLQHNNFMYAVDRFAY